MAKFLTIGGISTIFSEVKKYVTSVLSNYAKTSALSGYVTKEAASAFATIEDVNQCFNDLVGSAPESLDTLQEIAAALGEDANLSATLTTEIAKKAAKSDVYTKQECDAKYATADNLPDVAEITTAEIVAAATAAFAA